MKARPTGALAVVSLVAAGLALAGCTEVQETLNKGGDTSCHDYLGQDQDKQRMTVTKFLKQRNGSDHEPSGTAVDATMTAVKLLCAVQSNSDVPIKNANIGGILPQQ
jgi:acid stress chaperone HdeA